MKAGVSRRMQCGQVENLEPGQVDRLLLAFPKAKEGKDNGMYQFISSALAEILWPRPGKSGRVLPDGFCRRRWGGRVPGSHGSA